MPVRGRLRRPAAQLFGSGRFDGWKCPGAVQDLRSRAIEPDRVVPPVYDRQAVRPAVAAAAKIGKPGIRTLMRIVKAANPRRVKTREDLAQYVVDLDRVAGSRTYPRPEQELREHGRQVFDRGGLDEAAVQRQTAAIAAAGDRRKQLSAVTAPTLVIHGDADQMMLPAGGRETAAAIPGARLVTYPGMAHGLPRELWPEIVAEIRTNASRSAVPTHHDGT